MQRQKTIAKWLAVILLSTIVIACYVLFDNLYGSSVSDATGGKNNASASDDKDKEEDPPIHIPFYSTFPRSGENINGVGVQHIGGEGDDILAGAVVTGAKKFIFVKSGSEEYDTSSKGLLLALIEGDDVKSVSKFAGEDETFLDCKLTANGIAVMTKSEKCGKLYLFDTNGTLIARNDTELAERAKFYLYGKTLYLFYYAQNYVHIARINENLIVDKSNFQYYFPNAQIKEIFVVGNKLTFAAQDENHTVKFVTFDEYKGFKCVKELLNLDLVQIGVLSSQGEMTLMLLGKHINDFVLLSLDAQFSTLAQAVVQDVLTARFLIGDGNISLVTENSATGYCRHLDIISQTYFDETLGDIVYASPSPSKRIFGALSGGEYRLFALEGTKASELLSINRISAQPSVYFGSGIMHLLFNSRKNDGLCHMNFGGDDVFMLSLTLDNR